jgi:hypothetical protein
MNCTTVRQHLLASERPDQPGPAVARHLGTCSACRGWQRRLVQLERDIPRLPVPASRPPAGLLEQVLHGPGPSQLIEPPFRLRIDPDATRAGGRQKLALAFALAASLVVFALGWWAWPRHEQPRISPVVADYRHQRDTHLAKARTPAERVSGMADLADQFMEKARASRDRPGQLADLAVHFELLGQDLRETALQVPPTRRAAVLRPIAKRLGEIESTASRLAAAWDREHRDSARSLRRIAAAARKADRRLSEMVAT